MADEPKQLKNWNTELKNAKTLHRDEMKNSTDDSIDEFQVFLSLPQLVFSLHCLKVSFPK